MLRNLYPNLFSNALLMSFEHQKNISVREVLLKLDKPKQFFNVLKLALDFSLSDLDTSICRLRDLYMGLTDGGLE